ncbi:MAG TPA: nucleotidyltransferase domain-containing protein [Solirubrobacteraceae bacterium]|jgi:hypothetical protein
MAVTEDPPRVHPLGDALPPAPRGATLVQRLALAADRPALRRLWTLAYTVAARAYGGWLLAGRRGATLYVRGSVASGEATPGRSDLDLAVVTETAEEARAVADRHASLERAAPWVAVAVLELPRIYRASDLERVAGATVLTFDGAAYSPELPAGIVRHLERGTDDVHEWRRLRGPERRPRRRPPTAQATRIEAWLEVQYRWRWAWRAIGGELPPVRERDVLEKVVAETARASEAVAGGPVEEARELARREEPVPAALDLAAGLAREIAAQIARGGGEDGRVVSLLAADDELVLPWGRWAAPDHLRGAARSPLPLADWRAVVRPWWPDEALVPVDADARDVSVLRALQRSVAKGPYPALPAGGVLLLVPGRYFRSALRTVQAPFSDPVSFALLDGRREARFPAAGGWSAADEAARAVQEHRTALRLAADDHEGLGHLIGAARAALFAQSLDTAEPALPLTARATVAALADRAPAARPAIEEAFHAYRERDVTPAVVGPFRRVVAGLEPYR